MKEHQFRKLTVWQRSMIYVTKIYALTSTFPRVEQFGLIDQLRRATTSIVLNIAEGSGSGSNQEFLRFLMMAKRSGYEVITGLEIVKNLHYGSEKDVNDLIREVEEICSMITGLSRKLRS
ncbi:four helix bundle protein [Candidatus Gottesmanbacteria bacterium]|nr:four helix bundle protein [Candidatus Gottesmanbacteria bacterium]